MKKRTSASNAVDAMIDTATKTLHPLEMQSQDDILEAYIAATARFVKACGYKHDEWHIVQIWARKIRNGEYSNDIRVSVNGEYIGETQRKLP